MQALQRPALVLWVTLLCGLTLRGIGLAAQPEEQIVHWRTHYGELTPADDPRVTRVRGIFQRLLQAAGKGQAHPQLLIVKRDPWGVTLPVALPDGWIVLSKGVLDLCYRDPAWGDDRLAFVLGHEIAHQLRGDLWHLQFFQRLETAKTQKTPQSATFAEVQKRILDAWKEERQPQEYQADERGLLYAVMAGFRTQAIVADSPAVNFFQDWLQARGVVPERASTTHPAPAQRAAALKTVIQQILDRVSVFEAGLWFYYAGDYAKALSLFAQFQSLFPSREVYHNLAASHHQMALQAYRFWKGDTPLIPFQLSLAIDPLTLASQVYLHQRSTTQRGSVKPTPPAELFRDHLDQAITSYGQARDYDPTYTPAALNLGCALLLRGVHGAGKTPAADLRDAASILERALEHAPQSPQLFNNLGVALFYADRLDGRQQAHAWLQRAHALAPNYAAAVFNLQYLAHIAQQEAEAQRYQALYAQLTQPPSSSVPAGQCQAASDRQPVVGDLVKSVPAQWGEPVQHAFQLEGLSFTVATYPNGARTVSRDGELRLIVMHQGCRNGITPGSKSRDLLTRYGTPSRRLETTQGQTWSYDTQRIAFQLRDDAVVSWLLY